MPAMMVKPVPEIEAEFTVTADVPEDVRMTVLVVAELTVTLPNARLLAPTVS